MRRRVTFSRNVTLSLSRTCVSHCKYCAFATHRPHLHEPEEVERLLDGAARRNVKELLVLTGDEPGHHPGVRERLAELGLRRLRRLRRVVLRARARARPAAAHEPRRARPRRPRAAARGDRQPGPDARVAARPTSSRTRRSPTKDPALRLATMRAAEELRIPFTSGILVGIGETEEDRMAALEALAGFAQPPGGHPPELRPAPPLLRRGAGRDRHGGGGALLAHRPARRARTCPRRRGRRR